MAMGLAVLVLLATFALPGCGSRATSSTSGAPPSAPGSAAPAPTASPTSPVTFAIIGDYGMDDANEAAVAKLVASWEPAYIITTGYDYYHPAGGTGTGQYDESTGAYYGPWLKDISTTGTRMPQGKAAVNAFFPSMGNHDYTSAEPSPITYLTYFTLPGAGFTNTSGNERYYDFVHGRIHFFVLNSNAEEPDGVTQTSNQAAWLKTQLAASSSEWNVVYDHHPPYSSDDKHGMTRTLQWPYSQWGADTVISGHAHTYERVMRDGIVYFVNGLGGAPRYGFKRPVAGSKLRFNANWGAQKVTVGKDSLIFEFYDVSGTLRDRYRLARSATAGN